MDKKIDLMIIGTQKSGTSSIIRYLEQHKDLCVHNTVEFNYFLREDIYKQGFEEVASQYFDFKKMKSTSRIAAKNVGVMYDQKALERLYKHNPEVKLAIFLRNPVDRAYSAYLYAVRKGWETLSFEEAMATKNLDRFKGNAHMIRNCRYIDYGEYGKYIQKIYKTFPKENVLIFVFENVVKDWNKTLNEMFQSIGLNEVSIDTSKKHNIAGGYRVKGIQNVLIPGSRIGRIAKKVIPFGIRNTIRRRLQKLNEKPIKKEKMSDEMRMKLETHFVSHNNLLEQMLDVDLSIWNK